MTTVLFRNARVFDGHRPELLGADVLVEDGSIREVAEGRAITFAADETIDCAGRTLMPGLIDLHVHIWCAELNVTSVANAPTEYLALFAASFLRGCLDRGFTTLRDAGGTDAGYAMAIERGFVESPRFYQSGRYISQTGGHGDFRAGGEPNFALANCECCPPRHLRFTALADGADEVRKAVREEFRRGAKAIKIMASGGVASPTDPMDKLQYTNAEIAAAVDEAAMRGSYVFAHCHPDAAIARCSELGVRCIEHASLITAGTARLLAANGTYAVPTLAVAKAFTDDGARLGLPEFALRKVANLLDRMLEGLGHMKAAGVKMGFGTDLLGPHHDRQGTEFGLRAQVLPAFDILRSATTVAAEILMEEGRLGVVAPDAWADLLVVDGDPLADVTVLGRSGTNLPVIMKAGRFHKRSI